MVVGWDSLNWWPHFWVNSSKLSSTTHCGEAAAKSNSSKMYDRAVHSFASTCDCIVRKSSSSSGVTA